MSGMKRALLLACSMLLFYAAFPGAADADIPSGVKDRYDYGTTDESIVTVKEQLKELGYFTKNAEFNNMVSEQLREAVICFQEINGLEPDGEVSRAFQEALFSDGAVGKDGIRPEETAAVSGSELPVIEAPSESRVTETAYPAAAPAWTAGPAAASPAPVESHEAEKRGAFPVPLLPAAAGLCAVVLLAWIFVARRRKKQEQSGWVFTCPRCLSEMRVNRMPGRTAVRCRCASCGAENVVTFGDAQERRCVRLYHPHYTSIDEYECGACGHRFRSDSPVCPFCGAVFSRTETDDGEYREEYRNLVNRFPGLAYGEEDAGEAEEKRRMEERRRMEEEEFEALEEELEEEEWDEEDGIL